MEHHLPNERDLLQRAGGRDEVAFSVLVQAYTPILFRIVRRMATDTMEAESIVQETFWRFWNVLPGIDLDRPLLPYFATVASNLARDRYRRERRIEDVDPDSLPESRGTEDLNIEEGVDQKNVLENLAKAVEALPFAYRAVISLRYDADMSYEKISKTLGLPLNTVRTHLRRAKLILRQQIEEADHG